MRFFASSFCAVCVLFPLTAFAGVPEGVAAFKRGDAATAYRELKEPAQAGNAETQAYLGATYEVGAAHGTPDPVTARRWYESASQKGFGPANAMLGLLYARGAGVPPDFRQAKQWFEKGVAAGDPLSMLNLATLYETGQGVTSNQNSANNLIARAAALGNRQAAARLETNIKNPAVRDFKNAQSLWQVGKLPEALAFGLRAAKTRLVEAQAFVGTRYYTAQGARRDYAEATRWFEKAAAQNSPDGLFSLGHMHEFGLSVPKDRPQALALFDRAAKLGSKEAKIAAANLRSPEYDHPPPRLGPSLGNDAEAVCLMLGGVPTGGGNCLKDDKYIDAVPYIPSIPG